MTNPTDMLTELDYALQAMDTARVDGTNLRAAIEHADKLSHAAERAGLDAQVTRLMDGDSLDEVLRDLPTTR